MPLGKAIFTHAFREQAIDLLFRFDGRIGRSDYWIAWPLWIIANVAMFLVTALLGWLPYLAIVLWLIFSLLLLNSAIAVGRKRLHDRGKSGWWLLLFYLGPTLCQIAGQMSDMGLILSYASFALVAWAIVELGVLPGTVGPNRYGPDQQDPHFQPG